MKTHAKAVNSNKNIFKKKSGRILIYGIGNPSRQDDALGILFTELMRVWTESRKTPNISFDSNYQLNIEDALNISEKDTVIFVDASVEEDIDSFSFRPIKASKSVAFSTHSMEPESVVSLCKELFGKKPAAYLLTIRGYSWELSAQMTEKAHENLTAAMDYTKGLLV